MTYSKIHNYFPRPIRKRLPDHGQEICLKAFNSAFLNYQDRHVREKEKLAHQVAWSAVKKAYEQRGDTWVKKED